MKNIYLFIILILFPLYLFGQFAPVAAEWHYSFNYNEGYQRYVCTKDSVSSENGKTYQVINGKTIYYFGQNESQSKKILYQENGEVYFLFENNLYLIYDFNAQEGDIKTFYALSLDPSDFTKTIVLPVKYKVEHITELVIDGNSYKRFETLPEPDDSYLLGEGYDYPGTYVYNEKTGNEREFILTVSPPHPSIDDSSSRCYSDAETNYITAYWQNTGKPCDYYYHQLSSVKAIENEDIQFSVNKEKQTLSIKCSLPDVVVELFDLQGICFLKKQIGNKTSNVLNLSGLPAGGYIVVVNNNGVKIYSGKIVL